MNTTPELSKKISMSSAQQLILSFNSHSLPDEINRQAAIHALDQVGNVQPGFLKSAAKTLVIRYKGSDEIKKALATVALDAIFIEKKAEKLIEDQEVLDELKAKRNEVVQQQEEIQIREAKIVEEVQRTGLDFSVIAGFPELKTIGQYYNNSVLNQNEEQGSESGSILNYQFSQLA